MLCLFNCYDQACIFLLVINYYVFYLYSSYSFPKDTIVLEKWILKLNLDYIFTPTRHTRICSNHFNDDDFIKTDQVRRLKPNSIPTKMMGVRRSLLPSNA